MRPPTKLERKKRQLPVIYSDQDPILARGRNYSHKKTTFLSLRHPMFSQFNQYPLVHQLSRLGILWVAAVSTGRKSRLQSFNSD